jgi:hypothetical protein
VYLFYLLDLQVVVCLIATFRTSSESLVEEL